MSFGPLLLMEPSERAKSIQWKTLLLLIALMPNPYHYIKSQKQTTEPDNSASCRAYFPDSIRTELAFALARRGDTTLP